ncbi:MAG: hypothetical protein LC754_06575 [Acidobacteria bacterium]|nr:hypothetical protein [Acidobacteriota bacterium]
MKNVSVIYLICIFLGAGSLANAQSASKCFRADWLQGERTVNFTINGSKVAGTFSVGSGDDHTRRDATYEFSGTLRGNTLTVAFADNKMPDVAPSEMKSLIWTLVKSGDKESLRIKFHGKNYQTNKYEDRFADFESCGSGGYTALAKTAQTVHFAKGASSASIGLKSHSEFQAMRSPATFLINAAKSQSLEIRADGCTIEVYLPNKKIYEFVEWEDKGKKTFASPRIDRMLIEALPETGTYLIVLRKPSENMRPETVTFKATN